MWRASAVTYLLERRRVWLEKIAATPSGNVELESKQIELIERLVLDVRAGRVRTFALTHPKPVEIIVTN